MKAGDRPFFTGLLSGMAARSSWAEVHELAREIEIGEVRRVDGAQCQGCGADVPMSSPLCETCGPRYDDACDAGDV